jgi:DNA polymerase
VLELSREQVYIGNVVKCRPPGNRQPAPDETAACLPFLEAQIEAVAPDVLLVLGGVAMKALFGTDTGIKRARGLWRTWRGIPALPTFHPAYLLRTPADKRLVFEDLKSVRARLAAPS